MGLEIGDVRMTGGLGWAVAWVFGVWGVAAANGAQNHKRQRGLGQACQRSPRPRALRSKTSNATVVNPRSTRHERTGGAVVKEPHRSLFTFLCSPKLTVSATRDPSASRKLKPCKRRGDPGGAPEATRPQGPRDTAGTRRRYSEILRSVSVFSVIGSFGIAGIPSMEPAAMLDQEL